MRGDILEWFKTDRKQKVVLNNTESEIGCLYAGLLQRSVLAQYYFYLYVDLLQTIHLLEILVTIYKSCRTWLFLTSQTLKSEVKIS